jgi:uncharacterized SAM-binding protein YcdF (DUF218 family)
MEHDLLERGVPKEKILPFAQDADNTREEAEALARLAVDRRWKSLVIVTSNYHTRRARYIFRRVFPPGIEISVASAQDGDFDPERWWEKRKSIKLFMSELMGMAVALWELRRSDGASNANRNPAAEVTPSGRSRSVMHSFVTDPQQTGGLSLYIS